MSAGSLPRSAFDWARMGKLGHVSKSKAALSMPRSARPKGPGMQEAARPTHREFQPPPPQPNGNVGVDHNSRRQKPETGTLLARWGLIMLHPWPRKTPDAIPARQRLTGLGGICLSDCHPSYETRSLSKIHCCCHSAIWKGLTKNHQPLRPRAVLMLFVQKTTLRRNPALFRGMPFGLRVRVPCAGNESDWIVNEAVRCVISNPVNKEH